MITVINPAFLTLVVDNGRFGLGHIGVPPSSGLDRFALDMARAILGIPGNAPVLEIMGNDFSLSFSETMTFAITGARVNAALDGEAVESWSAFTAPKDSILKVTEVLEGFRYYIGFSGMIDVDPAMDSYTTNLECRFGGFHGRPLMKGDVLTLRDMCKPGGPHTIPGDLVPFMKEPHVLRMLPGPEADRFKPASVKFLFDRNEALIFRASARLNRTGIRLEGTALEFRERIEQSIISEGILPGTIQVPGDGLPIINCVKRTIGGYARLGTVIDVDLDRLAHIRPFDRVILSMTDHEEARRLSQARKDSAHQPQLAPGTYFTITVRDTGKGMEPAVMRRIFEPFYTTKEPGKGTGMRLAVVYGIVTGLKGDITVESVPGEGTSFHIMLPVVETKSKKDSLPAVETPRGRGKILFIDDDELLAELAKGMLERLGYEVTSMTDSREAFQLFSRDPSRFDLVFTDQTMPKLTGLKLAQEILKIRPNMPVLLYTGHSDVVSFEAIERIGIKGSLMKPLTKQEAAKAVRRVLDEASK